MDHPMKRTALGGSLLLVVKWLWWPHGCWSKSSRGRKWSLEGHMHGGHLDEDSSGYSFQFLLSTIFYGLKIFSSCVTFAVVKN